MTKKHGNTKWATKDGKLVFWICEDDLADFGYLYKDDGEKIPLQLLYCPYRAVQIISIDYFDGMHTTFGYDFTRLAEPSIDIWASHGWYCKGAKKWSLSVYDSNRELADSLGFPEDMTLYMVETNIPPEKVKAEYPEIHLPPNHDLYLLSREWWAEKPTYEEIVERYGVCDAYIYGNYTYRLACYYGIDQDNDGVAEHYWEFTFHSDGSFDLCILCLPEEVPADAIPVKEGDPAPKIPPREIEQEETKAPTGIWDVFRKYFFGYNRFL